MRCFKLASLTLAIFHQINHQFKNLAKVSPSKVCLTHALNLSQHYDDIIYSVNQFTPEGKQEIKEAVTERNSVGGMTELKLSV